MALIIIQSVIIVCLLKERRLYRVMIEIHQDYIEQLKTRLRGSTHLNEK